MSFQLSSNPGAATQYLAEVDPFDSFYDELESGGVEVFVETESESPAVAPLKALSPPPAETEVEVRLRSCLQESFGYFRGNLEQAGEQAKVSTYIASREIPQEVADRFQIGWAPEGWTALRDHLSAEDGVP